jgi:hypothetical protein
MKARRAQIDYPCFVQGTHPRLRSAEQVSRDAARRAVCDLEFLAGR